MAGTGGFYDTLVTECPDDTGLDWCFVFRSQSSGPQLRGSETSLRMVFNSSSNTFTFTLLTSLKLTSCKTLMTLVEEWCSSGNNKQTASSVDQTKCAALTCWAPARVLLPTLPSAAGLQPSLTTTGDHNLTTHRKQEEGEPNTWNGVRAPRHRKSSMPDFHHLPQWHPITSSTKQLGIFPISHRHHAPHTLTQWKNPACNIPEV